MSEKKNAENISEEQSLTDNSADNPTNGQIADENMESEANETDNSAEELAKMKDSYLRLMAEYDNYRKRTIKEKAELIKNGGERVLTGLLPVLDDLDRALQNITPDMDMKGVLEGVELIRNKFVSFLKQNGVQAIEADGQLFDEELFDAIATVPAPDEESKGKVIDCVQKGYMLNEKVIRHAKVVVAG